MPSPSPDRADLLSQQMDAFLGTMTDAELASIVGLPYEEIVQRRESRNIPEYTPARNLNDAFLARLGTMPDQALGLIYGVPTHQVVTARRERRIRSCGQAGLKLWNPHNLGIAVIAKIGKMPDATVAEQFHVPVRYVLSFRQRHGIPAFDPGSDPAG